MSNVGSAPAGKTLVGAGNGSSPTFADIGTNSGLTAHGVVVAEGNSAFAALSPGTSGQVLVSNGAGSDPSFQSVSTSGAVTSIAGNTGSSSPSGGVINLITANSTVKVTGSGATLTEDFNVSNLILGANGAITTGVGNTGVGAGVLASVAGGQNNTCVGSIAGDAINSGNENTLLGKNCGGAITGGGQNVCIGVDTGTTLTSGSSNIFIGKTAGNSFSSGVNNNICIGEGATGSGAVSNSTRIGNTQTTCFIAGVTGVTVASSAPIAVNSSGQISSLGFGSSGQILQSTGAASSPAYTTATYPGTAGTTGTILRSNGTNIVNTTATYPTTTTANRILYSSATNTISEITSAANSILSTDGSSVPTFGTSLSNDYTFTTSTAGATRALTVSNTDNTNGSSAAVSIMSTGGTSSGDAYDRYVIGTARSYAAGIDNSDSQSYVINTGASATTGPSTGNRLVRLDSSGNMSLPLNSCVTADLNTGLTNATGDATFIDPVIFDTDTGSFFDQNGNYDTTTGIFTAPATGKYLVTARVTFNGIGIAHTSGIVRINLNGSAYMISQFNPALSANAAGEYTAEISGILPIAATGTCAILAQVSGGTKTVGVKGQTSGSFTSLSVVLIS